MSISGISGATPPHVVHPHGKHAAAAPGQAAAALPSPPPAAAKADNDGDSDAGKHVNLKA